MIRLLGVVVTVGLADSLNVTTIGPGLFLATSRGAAGRVAQFTLGVFIANLVAGLILTVGPGRLLVALVPHPQGTVRHVLELIAGIALVTAAAVVWVRRRHLARQELPGRSAHGSSALMLGGTIAILELPTALPYFAVITGLAASSATLLQQILLLGIYNLAFVLPLVAIILIILAGGDRADGWLRKAGDWLQRRWPAALAVILLLIGGGLLIVGGIGLVRQ